MTEQLRARLSTIVDADLGRTLGELSAIHDIVVEGTTVKVYLTLIQPLHLVATVIHKACLSAITEIMPAAKAEIYVQEVAPQNAAKRGLGGVKNLIAVSSGKGGVGKSTIAANIAAGLASFGAQVGLVDADIHGPSVPTMFDLEGELLRGEKTEDGKFYGYPHEKYGIKLASMGFIMGREQAAVMRGPMQAGYFSTLIEQIYWGDLDFMIFDLPPGTGDIQLTMAQKVPLTGAVIVTTPQNLALADVRRGITMFTKTNIPVLGVVENMSYYVLPDGTCDYIFGEGGGKRMAAEQNVPFLGEVPLNIRIRQGGDEGMPIVLREDAALQAQPIKDVVAQIIKQVRLRNFALMQTPTVEIAL